MGQLENYCRAVIYVESIRMNSSNSKVQDRYNFRSS